MSSEPPNAAAASSHIDNRLQQLKAALYEVDCMSTDVVAKDFDGLSPPDKEAKVRAVLEMNLQLSEMERAAFTNAAYLGLPQSDAFRSAPSREKPDAADNAVEGSSK